MSQVTLFPIRCPQCGADQEAALYESVNVGDEPALRDRLMRNELNRVACAQCGASFRVDPHLFYHDPARQILIYWIPTAANAYAEGERQFREALSRLAPLLPKDAVPPTPHLVFSRAELVERIFLLEAGLNERIVEYIKHMIYTRNLAKLDPAKKALLFDTEDSTPDHLVFVVQDVATGALETLIQYQRSAYDALCEAFDRDDQTPSLLDLFPGPYISARALLLKGSAQA